MLTINIITLFPDLFKPHLQNLPFKKAIEKGLLKVNLVNLRDYAVDKRGTVDDKPYGGGTGMILMIEPIYKALEDIKAKTPQDKIIVLSPAGEQYTQKTAEKLCKLSNFTLICGRYEGIDERVREHFATDTISVGNYVVSGGELPALIIMESAARLLPGVLEKENAAVEESFTGDYIEFPQYTRPEDFMGKKVPEVLLSGNHKEIQKWREKHKNEVTPHAR